MYLERKQKDTITLKARVGSSLRKKKNQLVQMMLKRFSKTNPSHAPSSVAKVKRVFLFVCLFLLFQILVWLRYRAQFSFCPCDPFLQDLKGMDGMNHHSRAPERSPEHVHS